MRFLLRIAYPLFVLISLIVPRNKKIWVFGNQKKYFDNTKYFFEYVSDNSRVISVYWLANNESELSEVKSKGYDSVLKKSLKGFWLSSRASFSFICNGFSDVNRLLALNGKVISFWHGTPIKKIYLDSRYDLKKLGDNKLSIFISSLVLKYLNSNIDFYYASNEFERVKITSAASIKIEKSLALGVPRFDYIRSVKPPRQLLDLVSGRKVILYAPTWRENESWPDSFIVNPEIYVRLNEFLSNNNSVLLVKLHPLTKKSCFMKLGLISSSNIVYSDEYEVSDINALYGMSHALISDLSSTIFDFLLYGKPVNIFMPDYMSYINGERGVYSEFESLLSTSAIVDWSVLVDCMAANSWLSNDLLEGIARESAVKLNVNKSILSDLSHRFDLVL